MEVPRHWRNKGYLLNPNRNGYRPDCSEPVNTFKAPHVSVASSAEITCPDYNGASESLAFREVKSYSQILLPEVAVEKTTPQNLHVEPPRQIKINAWQGVVYQSQGVTA